MLAEQHITPQSGFLSDDVHLPATSLHALILFIADELPRWRDDPVRPVNTSETDLTDHLCDYLESIIYKSPGFDSFRFRTEVTDERHKSRKIDLALKPRSTTIWIGPRAYTKYQTLLPIECKILPTPKGAKRDEREYVINRQSSTGGIQRFKAGHHGSAHKFAAMIAYVQQETLVFWEKCVAGWIKDLVESGQHGWTTKDQLHLDSKNDEQGITIFSSLHERDNDQGEIELRHLWLKMN
ncbi:MAG: hypothetical protein JST85_05730 [Acidobacteria bacterium]|nr:hypothetical protein [Acidobacteriota bacterium]